MNIRSVFFVCLFVPLFLYAPLLQAETDPALKAEVDALVLQLYMDGINYHQANALGADAIPYLAELLHDQEKKTYWVNIIVTMGFIESPDALEPLTDFMDSAEGEVDIATFRALLSVPYAIGCIASSGGQKSLDYLTAKVDAPDNSRPGWSFGNKNIENIIAEQAITGLAMSGRSEALAKLTQLRSQQQTSGARNMTKVAQQSRTRTLDNALTLIQRFQKSSRAAVFTPQPGNQ